MTFRERGWKIGDKVRFVDDLPSVIRVITTDEQLDYDHQLPWIFVSAKDGE